MNGTITPRTALLGRLRCPGEFNSMPAGYVLIADAEALLAKVRDLSALTSAHDLNEASVASPVNIHWFPDSEPLDEGLCALLDATGRGEGLVAIRDAELATVLQVVPQGEDLGCLRSDALHVSGGGTAWIEAHHKHDWDSFTQSPEFDVATLEQFVAAA